MTESDIEAMLAHSPAHLERVRLLLASANPAAIGQQLAAACHTAAAAMAPPYIPASDRRAIGSVVAERRQQRRQWSDGHDDEHTAAEWAALISYHATKNVFGGLGSRRYGFVQVAAVALAAVQAIDREVDRMAGPDEAEAPACGLPPEAFAAPPAATEAPPATCAADARRKAMRAEIDAAEAESRRLLADRIADILTRHAAISGDTPFVIDCRDL